MALSQKVGYTDTSLENAIIPLNKLWNFKQPSLLQRQCIIPVNKRYSMFSAVSFFFVIFIKQK